VVWSQSDHSLVRRYAELSKHSTSWSRDSFGSSPSTSSSFSSPPWTSWAFPQLFAFPSAWCSSWWACRQSWSFTFCCQSTCFYQQLLQFGSCYHGPCFCFSLVPRPFFAVISRAQSELRRKFIQLALVICLARHQIAVEHFARLVGIDALQSRSNAA